MDNLKNQIMEMAKSDWDLTKIRMEKSHKDFVKCLEQAAHEKIERLPDHEEPPEPAFINWLCERFKTLDYEEIKRRIDRIGNMEDENPYFENSIEPWNHCARTIKEIMEGME